MNIDTVFSGGGAKAYAFIGVLERMEASDLHIVRTSGTSAGAIVAGCIAAGYTSREIKEMMLGIDLETFLDPPLLTKYIPFSQWVFFYRKMGFYRGGKLEQWLFEILAHKGVHTFKDLAQNQLKMVVSDITLGKLVVLPDDLYAVYGIDPNHFSVATAIRMSAGFPYFFMPKRLQGQTGSDSLIVDGGLLSNFPMWIFGNGPRKKRPLIGVHFTEEDKNDLKGGNGPHNALDMIQALSSTMKEAHDTRYMEQSQLGSIISIPVADVRTTDFTIDEQRQQKLITKGYQQADHFLSRWPG